MRLRTLRHRRGLILVSYLSGLRILVNPWWNYRQTILAKFFIIGRRRRHIFLLIFLLLFVIFCFRFFVNFWLLRRFRWRRVIGRLEIRNQSAQIY